MAAIFSVLFIGFIAFLILGTVVALVQMLVRLLAALAILAAIAAGALVAGLLGGVLLQALAESQGAADPSAVGRLSGVLAGGATFAGLVMWRLRRGDDVRRREEQVTVLPPDAGVAPQLTAPVQESDPGVRAAWDMARELLPLRPRKLRSARDRCAQLLALAEDPASGLDSGLIDAAALIRRNLPALVNDTAALWPVLDAAGRETHSAVLLENLDRLGRHAQREIARHRGVLEERLAVVHAHIASRTAED